MNTSINWQAISLEDANALWERLESHSLKIQPRLQGLADRAWVVGEHGNQVFAFLLVKNLCTLASGSEFDAPVPRLPRIPIYAGMDSLFSFLREVIIPSYGAIWRVREETIGRVPELLRSLFIHHATKPIPKAKPVAVYDPSKTGLRFGAAERIAEIAVKKAFKTARPAAPFEFADRWACEALAYVMGEETKFTALTSDSANQLQPLQIANVHRTKHDLVAQTLAVENMLEAERCATQEIDIDGGQESQSFAGLRRASTEAFQIELGRVHSGQACNLKPFSQRLIKGALLAKAAGARLPIGRLSDAVSEALALSYREALAYMQDAEIVVSGRPTPELGRDPEHPSVGSFQINEPNGTLLKYPRIILKAKVAILDPRIIVHELQHARQQMACEMSVLDLHRKTVYETERSEWQAKLAETEFLHEFGILY